MMRQSSSRNQRNKGFRVRHALQIGLLVAVCFWLLYQLKHSHDKKLATEVKNSKILNKAESHKEVFNLGRKGLPQTELGLSHDNQDDKVEKEVEEEEEKDGNQEDEADEEDGGGVTDDEIDEQDHEKGEEEELDGDEEKEIRDGEMDFFEDQEDHDRVAQEAHEENYKRDDVADSVHRQAQATEVEDLNEDARALNEDLAENVEKDDLVIQNVINEKSGLSTDQNTSDVGLVDESQANITSGVQAMSNLMPNSSKANEAISNHAPSNDTSVSINTWSEPSLSNGHLNVNNRNANEQKESVDEMKNLEVASGLKEESSSNSTSAVPGNQKTDSNPNLTGVVLESNVETQNNTIQLDMVTNEHQNETARQSTAEDHNSRFSLESQESNTHTKDAAVDSMNTRLGREQTSSNFSQPDKAAGGAHQEDDASSHHMVTNEEKVAHTDLSTLPNTHNDSRNVDDEPIELG